MQPLSISEHVLLLVSGLGVVQGLLLAALLYFHPKSDRVVNKFLALYILALSIIMCGPFFLRLFSWKSGFVQQPLPMIMGPMMYLYIRSYRETVTLRKALPQVLPFLLFYIVSYSWFAYLVFTYGNTDTPPLFAFQSPIGIMVSCVPYGHLVLYYFIARRELRLYQRTIRGLFSETSQIDLHWASWLINGYLFIVVNALVMYSLIITSPQYFNLCYLITIAVATPYIYVSTYKGITNLTIWQRQHLENKETLEVQLHDITLQLEKDTPVRNNNRMLDIAGRITLVMEQEKLYQETELTLQHLADKLQLPSYLVSQAINEGMNKNFYDLVNGLRVEEAKRLLQDARNKHYTVLSVGFEAGFNSKTTFNTVFKKFTGLTPSVFREQQCRTAEMA
ncbi:AraC family transcriptional regulator [Chitinophaga agrisoli]|uniref:AraC family transcriptional regulator n=1 Tax=Chitinophaga agrisoli TaxID=2607653 RepID=A0A5B2VS90_9BACT|nr:helix-turn-helix domain-containing protein [Chitinophaga agrisoli]KAA2241500.1 AraC family transcriptional regulator [Chitinophaga agrisoli]